MKNLDRFDDEVRGGNIDPAELEKQKSRTARIKRSIMFFVKLFLYHFVTMIIYGIALSSTVAGDVYEGMGAAKYILAVFSAAAILLFAFIISLDLKADGDRKRSFLALVKEQKLTPALSIQLTRSEAVIYTVIYFVFQLPICIFHHFFGFDALLTTILEQYFIMDIGFMELFSFGILGTLVSSAVFFVGLMTFHFLIYSNWSKDSI